MTWRVKDLFVDHKTGKLRETALWSNVGKATMTWGFVYQTIHGGMTEWFLLAYGAIVIVHEGAARFFNQRQQTLDKKAPT